MDADVVHIIIGQIDGLWTRPLEDFERDQWLRWLVPSEHESRNSEFVCEALLLAKHSPAFEFVRPDLVAMTGLYRKVERAHEPPPLDPAEKPATAATVRSVLEECRRALNDASSMRDELDRSRSKLIHEMARADADQGTFL